MFRSTHSEIEEYLALHPAVDEVRCATLQDVMTVTVVPSAHEAAVLHRACAVESAAVAKGLSLYEPADSLIVVQKNPSETDFLFREIWSANAYFSAGFALPMTPTIIDVGANIGMFSLLSAKLFQGARLIAIEPVPDLIEAIKYNAFIHAAEIGTVNAGIGSTEGEARVVYYPNNTVMSSLVADLETDLRMLEGFITTTEAAENQRILRDVATNRLHAESRSCRITTLSSLMDELRVAHVDLLKIDVENSEMEVLTGVSDVTWPVIDRIVMEVHDVGDRLADVVHLLRERGYSLIQYRDPALMNTDCFTVYATRCGERLTPTIQNTGTLPRIQWGSRKALAEDLAEALSEGFSYEPHALRFRFVDSQRFSQEHASGHCSNEAGGQQDESPSCSRPHEEIENALGTIWRDVLGNTNIDPSSDFFAAGGNSLSAIRLVSRIEQRFGRGALPVDRLFAAGSFYDIVEAICSSLNTD